MLPNCRFIAGLAGALLVACCTRADEASSIPAGITELAEMSKSGNLFEAQQYKKVRGICARVFETKFKDAIKSAYADDFDAISAWFEKQKDVKEEFYTAIDEKKDKVPQVLKIFHDLWKHSPDNVAKYSNLAIAIAVVWDDRTGIYDYRGHQVRTKSTLPESYGKMTPVDCFQNFIDKQKELKGKETFDRLQAFPWEFLVYVVDHATPVEERQWAIKNYLAKRPMIGRIYNEIEYDNEMLRTQGQVCKLNGQPYTLESIKKNGGVCAMQADFAARVGKSLIVPAAYVGGESTFRDLHAWVMWVEVKSITPRKIDFSLESWGRYLGDNYYTGTLRDPQTGEKILDRDMERRLSAVALDRLGKRQAELGMSYYEEICKLRELDQAKKVLFLDRCLSLCQFNETAWFELARQVREGELEPKLKQVVLGHMQTMLRTFAKYPDFTWKVSNDLIQIQTDKAARDRFFEQLVALYENARRPDLACEARLKWSEFQAEEKKWTNAAKGLSVTLQKFPDEGRYIPKLVDKLKEVCAEFKGGNDFLGKQYDELLKKIPPKRGNEVSKFWVQMHQDAIKFFKVQKGKEKVVKELEARLASVTGGKS